MVDYGKSDKMINWIKERNITTKYIVSIWFIPFPLSYDIYIYMCVCVCVCLCVLFRKNNHSYLYTI